MSRTGTLHLLLSLLILICVAIGLLGAAEGIASKNITARLATIEQKMISTDTTRTVTSISETSTEPAEEALLTDVIEKASPAVVSIVISKYVDRHLMRYENFFGSELRRPFLERSEPERQEVGAGTGFFLRSDGYILTNRHVVDDTEAEYTVVLADGTKKTASVMYRDDGADIAVLKIEGGGYTTIPLGDSSGLKIGQTVAAIGNALGEYDNSVSVGIVSGLDRTVQALGDTGDSETLRGVIQTDAAINLGNSGGPLLDLSGHVIGVTVAIQAAAANIAFAIPIDVVRSVLEKAMK